MKTIPAIVDEELYLLTSEKEISKKQIKFLKEHDGMVVVLNIPKTVREAVYSSVKQQLGRYSNEITLLEPEDYHITLFYFQDTGSMFKIIKRAERVSGELPSLKVRFGGVIRFAKVTSEGKSAIAAQVDAKEIQKFRLLFQERLEAVDVTVEDEHGFTPHMTLAYAPADWDMAGNVRLPKMKFDASSIGVWFGDERKTYDLNMDEVMRSVELRVSRYKEPDSVLKVMRKKARHNQSDQSDQV